jgi:hypothetical protein
MRDKITIELAHRARNTIAPKKERIKEDTS